MDPDLNAFTSIGQFQKIKQNFREIQTMLASLERSNRELRERVMILEARINPSSSEPASKLTAEHGPRSEPEASGNSPTPLG
jgi:hypothetical protein